MFKKLWLIILLTVPHSFANAAILDIVGGQLVGASGITIGGNIYDVEFVDGSCISELTGCNDAADFAFNTRAESFAASNALSTQVFNGNDIYDQIPSLTAGIDSPIIGLIHTPFFGFFGAADQFVGVTTFVNLPGSAVDIALCETVPCGIPRSFDFGTVDQKVLAKWSLVPIPGAIWLFGSALFGLFVISRTRRGLHKT